MSFWISAAESDAPTVCEPPPRGAENVGAENVGAAATGALAGVEELALDGA